MIQRRRHPFRPPADIDHGGGPVGPYLNGGLRSIGALQLGDAIPPALTFGTITDPRQQARHRRWLAQRRQEAEA